MFFCRCKGFLEACLSPDFKRFRLLLSYYTAYFQFPVTNASETASIFLTTLLSVERYMTMHNISYPSKTKVHVFRTGSSCCGKRMSSADPEATDNPDFNTSNGRDCDGLRIILVPLTCVCSGVRDNVKLAVTKVALLSLTLNIPLFFCQQVITREVVVATDTKTGTPAETTLKWGVGVTAFGNSRFYSIYTWLRTVFLQILPFIFLCLINFYLFKFIRMANARWKAKLSAPTPNKLSCFSRSAPEQVTSDKASLDVQQRNQGNPITGNILKSNLRNIRRQNAQRKLTVLLIAIVALFLAGQIPQAFAFAAIYQAILNLLGAKPRKLACSPSYRLYRVITNCICLLTYSANFLLYATLNAHFKRELARWCPVYECKRKAHSFPSTDVATAEDTKHCGRPRIRRATASADCISRGRQQMPPVGPISDVLAVVANRTNPDALYSTRSCSAYTWRASVAILSRKGGRPFAVAAATLDRSVSTTSARSQLEVLMFVGSAGAVEAVERWQGASDAFVTRELPFWIWQRQSSLLHRLVIQLPLSFFMVSGIGTADGEKSNARLHNFFHQGFECPVVREE
ncbi:unnamed protein product [Schistocephalus solidus]|uniref:G_PROTEIN_RECEP_F1_2 domain-containing protein n=1 Tax=Schistocephalus solidus TaxID=70667 RepID=A0A183TNS9_SCHSO|nr:unnamed protein product [Schistocephalus solidus]